MNEFRKYTDEEMETMKEKTIANVIEMFHKVGIFVEADMLKPSVCGCSYSDNVYHVEIDLDRNSATDESLVKQIKKKRNKLYDFLCVTFGHYGSYGADYEYLRVEYKCEELLGETVSIGSDKEELDNIVSKIEKLLSVTEDRGATENEALSASLLAQRLMKKYNIDYENLNAERDEEILSADVGVPKGNKWKYLLAQAVANGYCVKTYTKGTQCVCFYGYKRDVLIARRVFVYLYETAVKLSRKYRRERGYSERDFCYGFSMGVKEGLEKNCHALVLVTPQKVIDSYKEFSADFGCANRNYRCGQNGYQSGVSEGKKALNGQYIEKNNESSANRNSIKMIATAN